MNNYYLNYSDSQNGFCAYDASTYSQNETKDTNQYALYEVKSGVTPTPTPDPDPSEGDAKATLLFCSDFQTGTEVSPYQSVSDVPESLTSVMTNISKAIYDDGVTKIDRVLAVGDYTAYTGRYNYDADATIGIQAFKNIIQNRWTDTDQFLFIQEIMIRQIIRLMRVLMNMKIILCTVSIRLIILQKWVDSHGCREVQEVKHR